MPQSAAPQRHPQDYRGTTLNIDRVSRVYEKVIYCANDIQQILHEYKCGARLPDDSPYVIDVDRWPFIWLKSEYQQGPGGRMRKHLDLLNDSIRDAVRIERTDEPNRDVERRAVRFQFWASGQCILREASLAYRNRQNAYRRMQYIDDEHGLDLQKERLLLLRAQIELFAATLCLQFSFLRPLATLTRRALRDLSEAHLVEA